VRVVPSSDKWRKKKEKKPGRANPKAGPEIITKVGHAQSRSRAREQRQVTTRSWKLPKKQPAGLRPAPGSERRLELRDYEADFPGKSAAS